MITVDQVYERTMQWATACGYGSDVDTRLVAIGRLSDSVYYGGSQGDFRRMILLAAGYPPNTVIPSMKETSVRVSLGICVIYADQSYYGTFSRPGRPLFISKVDNNGYGTLYDPFTKSTGPVVKSRYLLPATLDQCRRAYNALLRPPAFIEGKDDTDEDDSVVPTPTDGTVTNTALLERLINQPLE